MDLSRKPGGKYFRNRKDELQVEKEREAIQRRALLAHYQGKIQDFPDLLRPSAAEPFFPTPPAQPKPNSDHVKKKKTAKNVAKPMANPKKKTHDGVCERKKASTQIRSVDDSHQFKFAIMSSLETTGPVPFMEREKVKWKEFKPEVTVPSRRVRGSGKTLPNAPLKSDQATELPQKAKRPVQRLTICEPTTPPPTSTSHLLTSPYLSTLSPPSTQPFSTGSSSSDALMDYSVSSSPQSHDRLSSFSQTPEALFKTLPSSHKITPPFCLNISAVSHKTLPTNRDATPFHHNTIPPLQRDSPPESVHLPDIASDVSYIDGNSCLVFPETDPAVPSPEATHWQMLDGEKSPLVCATPELWPSNALSGDDGKKEDGDEKEGVDEDGGVGEGREGRTAEMSDLSLSMKDFYADKDSDYTKAADIIVSPHLESVLLGNEIKSNQRAQLHSEEEQGGSDLEWRKEHTAQEFSDSSIKERTAHMQMSHEYLNIKLDIDMRVQPRCDNGQIPEHLNQVSSSVGSGYSFQPSSGLYSSVGSQVPESGKSSCRMEREARVSPESGNLMMHVAKSYDSPHGLRHHSSVSPTSSESHGSEYDRSLCTTHTMKSHGSSSSGSSIVPSHQSNIRSDNDSRNSISEQSSRFTVVIEDLSLKLAHDRNQLNLNNSGRVQNSFEMSSLQSMQFPLWLKPGKRLSLQAPSCREAPGHSELTASHSDPCVTSSLEAPGRSEPAPSSSKSGVTSSPGEPVATAQSHTGDSIVMISSDKILTKSAAPITQRAHPQMEGEERRGEGEVRVADGVVAAIGSTQTAEPWDMARTMDGLLQGNHNIPQNTLAEFLAFSDVPVKMEDVLKLMGMKAPIFTNPRKKESYRHKDSGPSDTRKLMFAKPIFLSTWRGPTVPGHSTDHHSIHHFCTEFHSPQLAPQLRMLSILTHANRNPDLTHAYLREMEEAVLEQGTEGGERRAGRQGEVAGQDDQKDFGGKVGGEDGENGVMYGRLSTFEERWGYDQEVTSHGDNDKTATPHFCENSLAAKSLSLTEITAKRLTRPVSAMAQSSSRYQVDPHSGMLENINGATDVLMDMARARLRKESRENKPLDPGTSVGLTGVRDRSPLMSMQVLAKVGVEKAGGGGGELAVKKMEMDGGNQLPGDVKDEATERWASSTLLKANVMKTVSLMWSLAPPKLSLPPSIIQACLFPDYIPSQSKPTSPKSPTSTDRSEVESRTEEKEEIEKEEMSLSSKMVSASPLSVPISHQPSSDMSIPADKTAPTYTQESAPISDQAEERMSLLIFNVPGSEPGQEDRNQDDQFRTDDFKTIMEEVQTHREQLLLHVEQKKYPERRRSQPSEPILESSMGFVGADVLTASHSSLSPLRLKRRSQKTLRKTTAARRTTSRSWSRSSSRSRGLKRTRSSLMRAQYARDRTSEPPRSLIRCVSYPCHPKQMERCTRQAPSTDYHKSPRLSMPAVSVEHFQALMLKLGEEESLKDSHYKWAHKQWWDVWLPEVLKESNEEVSKIYSITKVAPWLSTGPQPTTPDKPQKTVSTPRKLLKFRMISRRRHREKQEEEKKRKEEEEEKKEEEGVKEGFLELEDVEPVVDATQVENLEHEVKHLGVLLNKSLGGDGEEVAGLVAAYHCKRGSLFRKLGRLKESLTDLNESISLQPLQPDAYWSRHLLFLIQGNERAALEDVSSLLKLNKQHYQGHKSRALLLTKKGDLDKAIFALNHAIALQPRDPDLYFLRAELYEKLGESSSAMADYEHITRLDLTCTEPIRRQAMHKFKNRMFGAATQLFSDLLQRDPNDSEARIYRAKSLCCFEQYEKALQDLSAAIHLDPNNSSAFFFRACLLRTMHPHQAIKDFSVSLLLDSSAKNVSAYLHRGVLYAHLKSYSEALCDFEEAMTLDQSLHSPHVSAGLIHLMHRNSPSEAARCFSCAIRIEPTCLRAYLCRAEAYKREEKYELAALDYTRVIHLEPSNPVNYLYKGEVYLHLKDYKIASFHIESASNLATGFGQSMAQSALIDCFLGNHEQAISILSRLPRTLEVSTLLGKAQHKAKLFHEAAENFKHSLQLLDIAGHVRKSATPPKKFQFSPAPGLTKSDIHNQVEIHFLCGKSQVDGGAIKEAIHQFGRVLELLPNYAKAYYERGMAKMRLGRSHNGLLDINKSLVIDSNFFQAYLARAALFGQAGRYTKAILNCNEAIRISPRSIRAYLCRGSLKYLIRFYSGAIEDLDKAIELDHNHSSLAHFNRALCYQAMQKPAKALADYSAVLLIGEQLNLKVFVNRGLLYLHLQDYDNALLDFQDAGKLVPDDSAIFQAVGHCYHQLGMLDSAIQAYSEAISLDNYHLEAYVGRGNAYMEYLTEETGDLARADYLHVLDENFSHLEARVNLAFLLQREGKFQQAWDDLTTALTIDGLYVPALEARAIINLQMQNYFGALMDLTKALEVKRTAALYTNRGVVNQYMGDIYAASTDYQSALRLNEKYSLAHFNLGNLEFHQRLFSHAVTSYTRALSCSAQEDDSILVNRAIAYAMIREVEKALADFEHAMEVNPFSAHAYFNRGNLYKSTGKYEKAMQDYKRALELQPEDWLTLYYYGEMQGLQGDREAAIQTFHKAARIEIP